MAEETPDPDYERPRFLLPEGCKDLIDVLRLQQARDEEADIADELPFASEELPTSLPATVKIPHVIIVSDLAAALHKQPFQVVQALMQLSIFASVNTQLDFNVASDVCSHYGVFAIPVA